jgi:hypothetical protein
VANKSSFHPDQLYAYSGILDDLLTASVENPGNPVRQLKMNVEPPAHQEVIKELTRMEVMIELSAFLLDPSTLMKIEQRPQAEGMGMSIGPN